MENLEKLIKVCEMVSKDVEQDAKDFDGQPFDGRTVAKYLGYQGAAINALSTVLIQLLKQLDNGKSTS